MQLLTFKLNPMLIYSLKSPRALKDYVQSNLPVLYKWNSKASMTVLLSTTCFTDYLKLTLETYCSEIKISFKILLLVDIAPGHPRSLMEMYKEIHAVVMFANTSIL